MSSQFDVNTFFAWVKERQDEINGLEQDYFRRPLLLILLDTLAKCVYPNTANAARFKALIDNYSGWEFKNRISLLFLANNLKQNNASGCDELENFVIERMKQWPPLGVGRILFPQDVDPESSDLVHFMGGNCGQMLEKSRYPSVLWSLRNFAVHESMTKHTGPVMDERNPSPFYWGLLNIETGKRAWEFVIPSEVISNLVADCSDTMLRSFRERGINPYDRFDWETK